jgi:hypothetical protein
MPKAPISAVIPGHPDYAILSTLAADVRQRVPARLEEEVAERALDAVEFVLDPIRTGRTRLIELDNVEKTFVGLKIEHFIRDLLDAPKGVRDLYLGNVDVDVKNTIGSSWCWMIPPETFRAEEPCLLIASHEPSRRSWMGLIVARVDYLGAPNRDGKRRINSNAFSNILWLADGVTWAADRWAGIDMGRFRELRQVKPGARRAAMFFRENPRRATHRKVLAALLWDQLDPMKRLRDNGGAKDILREENIALLSGKYSNHILEALDLPRIGKDEFIAIPITNDAEREAINAA